MDLHERGAIQKEAESLLNNENRDILKAYNFQKAELAQVLFQTDLLELSDEQFDQTTFLARKIVPGAEKVLTDLANLEDWIIENRRRST